MNPALVVAAALIFTAPMALAEPALDPARLPPRVQLEALAHFGVATTPFGVTTLPEAKGQAFVLQVTGRYVASRPVCVELRAPLVFASVAQPAGSYVDTFALGNFQLGVRYQFLERGSAESRLALLGAAEIGAPTAGYQANLMPNRALAIADGIEGRAHPERFTPGVLPFTPSLALRWAARPWVVETELRLPLLVRVSDADLPGSSANPRPLGFASIVSLEGRYGLSRRLTLAAGAHFFFDIAPSVDHVRSVSRIQDFERVSLLVHLGSVATLAIDLQTAIAGELGGSTVAGGLRSVVNLR